MSSNTTSNDLASHATTASWPLAAIENNSLSQENKALKTQLKEKYDFEGLVGNSPPMQAVYELMERISTTESTVLVMGETGKELVTRALHYK